MPGQDKQLTYPPSPPLFGGERRWGVKKAPGGYPHTYNNYEGFSFTVAGPYLEFPMLSSGVYTGGTFVAPYSYS